MKALTFLTLCTLSLPVLAEPPRGPGPGRMDPVERQQRQDRREQHRRLAMVVGVAEALELSEAEALRFAEKLKAFDARRRPLRQEMRDSMRLLRQASQGEAAALGQVDAAITRILNHRTKLAELDRESFTVLAKDFSPQKRAQLALLMARHPAKGARRGPPHGQRSGPGARFGMAPGEPGDEDGPEELDD